MISYLSLSGDLVKTLLLLLQHVQQAVGREVGVLLVPARGSARRSSKRKDALSRIAADTRSSIVTKSIKPISMI
jgi:hypothetical protein